MEKPSQAFNQCTADRFYLLDQKTWNRRPRFSSLQIGPGQLGPGAHKSGAQMSALKKVANWAPVPNCLPLKSGKLGPRQLGPGAQLYGARLSRAQFAWNPCFFVIFWQWNNMLFNNPGQWTMENVSKALWMTMGEQCLIMIFIDSAGSDKMDEWIN